MRDLVWSPKALYSSRNIPKVNFGNGKKSKSIDRILFFTMDLRSPMDLCTSDIFSTKFAFDEDESRLNTRFSSLRFKKTLSFGTICSKVFGSIFVPVGIVTVYRSNWKLWRNIEQTQTTKTRWSFDNSVWKTDDRIAKSFLFLFSQLDSSRTKL